MKFNSIFLKMLTVGLFFFNSVSFGMKKLPFGLCLGLGETAAGAEVFNKYNFQQAVDKMDFEKIIALLGAPGAAPGVDVNYITKSGNTALMLASIRGHLCAIIALLAKQGINVNYADELGNTALIYAIKHGNLDMINALLAKQGINVNHANKVGNTALIFALLSDNLDVLKTIGITTENKELELYTNKEIKNGRC